MGERKGDVGMTGSLRDCSVLGMMKSLNPSREAGPKVGDPIRLCIPVPYPWPRRRDLREPPVVWNH